MDRLSENFFFFFSQLNNQIFRVIFDYLENHELLKDKYAPTYRKEANRNRRYRNTAWNISRKLIITTVIFALAYTYSPLKSS
jgi:hypothetical protein